MLDVSVHELCTQTTSDYPTVTFRRFNYDRPTTLPYHQQNLLSHNPLSIRVTIPPGARIDDMHEYEGKEVVLSQRSQEQIPRSNGE